MNRFGISTAQLLRRRAPTQRPPAVDTYRDRPGHLADAGGAYLVLPYGLLHTLNGDRQQHLVDILTALAAIRPSVGGDDHLPGPALDPDPPGRPQRRGTDLARHHQRHRPLHRRSRLQPRRRPREPGHHPRAPPHTRPHPRTRGDVPRGPAGTPARWPWTEHARSAADNLDGACAPNGPSG